MKCFFVVVALAAASSISGQTSGTFTPTSPMNVGRDFHSATLLGSGKVLIVGSGTSAELYDPADSTFSTAGNLSTPRSGPAVTLLADGRVLIFGGDPMIDGTPSTTTAEVYDPTAGTFTRTGPPLGLHVGSTATLLGNRKVLIAGGFTSVCCPAAAAKAELFDPATNMFSFAGPYAGPGDGLYVTDGPSLLNAARLGDGRVLLAGEPQSEIYDPQTGAFTLTGHMTTACSLGGFPNYIAGRTSTLLRDGRVLLTGGAHEDCGRFNNAELFDPATGTFSQTANMHLIRDNHTATLLRDGTLLITGGETDDCNRTLCQFTGTTASAEIYDPLTGRFTLAGEMTESRAGQTATLLTNGTVLIAGGYGSAGFDRSTCCFADAEIFRPAAVPSSGRRRVVH